MRTLYVDDLLLSSKYTASHGMSDRQIAEFILSRRIDQVGIVENANVYVRMIPACYIQLTREQKLQWIVDHLDLPADCPCFMR